MKKILIAGLIVVATISAARAEGWMPTTAFIGGGWKSGFSSSSANGTSCFVFKKNGQAWAVIDSMVSEGASKTKGSGSYDGPLDNRGKQQVNKICGSLPPAQ